MLRHRIIPVVLLDGYSVVKTIGFDVRRNLGNPIAVMRIYETRNVDEMIILDIDASKEGRHIDLFTIEDLASECFMPLTVGGGLRTCAEIEAVLKKGADKVVLNTEALRDPGIIKEASSHFGSQCIVVSIDAKKESDGYTVFSHAGLKPGLDVVDWAGTAERSGAGEIFLNSVDLDGKMTGYDHELISMVSKRVKVPVIACGGAGSPADCVKAIKAGASAAAAASMFHFADHTPEHCRKELRAAEIPAR